MKQYVSCSLCAERVDLIVNERYFYRNIELKMARDKWLWFKNQGVDVWICDSGESDVLLTFFA